jgi:hypothetical protein
MTYKMAFKNAPCERWLPATPGFEQLLLLFTIAFVVAAIITSLHKFKHQKEQ